VGIYVGKNPIPVDTAMIAQLNEIEKTEESIAKKHILNNRDNSTTTIYYLLLKRHLRKGGMSIADITKYNAEDFKPAHPNPVRKLQFIQKHRSQSQDCEPAGWEQELVENLSQVKFLASIQRISTLQERSETAHKSRRSNHP